MSSQFRTQGLKILEYMKKHNVTFDSTDRSAESTALKCMTELGFSAFEISRGMLYLLNQKLVIRQHPMPVTRMKQKKAVRGGIPLTAILVVNPDPPEQKPARPQKQARRPVKRAAPKPPAKAPAAKPAPIPEKLPPDSTPVKAAPQRVPERPKTDIDPVIQSYLDKALVALRGSETGNGEWLTLGVVNAEQIVYDRLGNVTHGQARRLVNILKKMKLFRTCELRPGGLGGCSHVHTQQVTAAMVRQAGYHAEETVEELQATLGEARKQNFDLTEELRRKEEELTKLRTKPALMLGHDLAARVQYLVLKALTQPLPDEEGPTEKH